MFGFVLILGSFITRRQAVLVLRRTEERKRLYRKHAWEMMVSVTLGIGLHFVPDFVLLFFFCSVEEQ